MKIYKCIIYNPHLNNIERVVQEAQDEEKWQFVRSQPVTEYEWVAIFEKWNDGINGVAVTPSPSG